MRNLAFDVKFRSYLTGRIQSVAVGGHLSDPLPVSIGLPQGSILGPLLFLLFLNDLPTIPQSCQTTMYADDTAECESASKPEDRKELESTINNDLYKVKEHFDTNKLSLNVPKCEFMLIGTYQSLAKVPDIRIHINNERLKQVTVSKYLGMKIDSNLKWDDHINAIIPKISSKIGILRSLRKIVPIETLKLIYNAIVQPYFDYSDIVYDSASKTNKDRLQKLQTRASRLITWAEPRTSHIPMFHELKWLYLQCRRDFHKLVMMYKCRNGLAPPILM